MNFPTMKVLAGVSAAVMMAIMAVALTPAVSLQAVLGIVFMGAAAVAFSTQVGRLRERERLVYRPVYVRSHSVQRRVRSAED